MDGPGRRGAPPAVGVRRCHRERAHGAAGKPKVRSRDEDAVPFNELKRWLLGIDQGAVRSEQFYC
jgi:hypothetical protein